MAYAIRIERSVLKMLARLPRADQRRIARKIDSLAHDPRPSGAKKLASKPELYRVRAGDYRIVHRIKDRELLVLVVRLGHRKEVYREGSPLSTAGPSSMMFRLDKPGIEG